MEKFSTYNSIISSTKFRNVIGNQKLTEKEIQKMADLLDEVRPTLRGWYFGHFHDDREIPVDVPARMLFRELVWL